MVLAAGLLEAGRAAAAAPPTKSCAGTHAWLYGRMHAYAAPAGVLARAGARRAPRADFILILFTLQSISYEYYNSYYCNRSISY